VALLVLSRVGLVDLVLLLLALNGCNLRLQQLLLLQLGFRIEAGRGDIFQLLGERLQLFLKLRDLVSGSMNACDSISISIRHVVASPRRATALSSASRLMSYRSENGMTSIPQPLPSRIDLAHALSGVGAG
jgi:hypothetical protein